jgi:hypothetical protein
MYRSRNKLSWVVPAVIIVLVVFMIILFTSGAFNKKSDDSVAISDDAGQQALVDVTDASGIRLTVRGKINAEQIHNSYQITVRPHVSEMKVYQGYLGNVIAEKTYVNNKTAYTEFSYALKNLGVMQGEELVNDQNDVRGVCPTGRLATFEVLDGNNVAKSLWHTTCSKDKQSFTGKYSDVEKLFKAQIVDYQKLLKGVKL